MINKIHTFKEVSSTQDTAKRFIHGHEEVAVFSLSQKRGKGRQGRIWFSPIGGMYLSLLLFPKTRLTSIPFLAALTIVKVLETYGFTGLSILWPNDVMLKRRKVCGILCEQSKDSIICGLGLNVNIERFDARIHNATSLKLESGRDYDVNKLLADVIDEFNGLYDELQDKGLRVKELLNYIGGLGEPIEITTSCEVAKGTVYDIDDDWGLLLREDSGAIRKFYYGDVTRTVW